jgi:hypothetical protein
VWRLRQLIPLPMLAALASSGAGCGTSYRPQASARLAVVIHHGAAMYVKDGRETPVGPLGGRLQDLVAESPDAAAHAHAAHTELAIGIPCYLTGVAGVVVGVAVLSGPIGWVVIGVGAATGGTGLGLMGAGLTHVVDAINVHNDAIAHPP